MKKILFVLPLLACGAFATPFETTTNLVFEAAANLPDHPRLFVKGPAGLKAILDSTVPEIVFLRERCVKQCEGMLKQAAVVPKMQGFRLRGQNSAKGIMQYCSVAYRFSGDRRFLRRAKEETLSVCAWPTWNCEHYLDTSEIMRGVAFAYDWLYDDFTPAERDTIRKALVERGFAGMDNGKHCRWRHCRHNWCQVCWQGVVGAALALWEDDPARSAALIAEGVRAVAGAVEEYGPDGSYPEGPGYWSYGTEHTVMMLHQLETAFGTTFGLYEMPGFARTGCFAIAAKGPTGQAFNYSDCGMTPSYVWFSPVVAYFASKAKRPEWMRLEKGRLADAMKGKTVNPLHAASSFRCLMWMDFNLKDSPELKPYPLDYIAHGANPIAILRSSYDRDAFFLGAKAGRVSVNHGNMDVGSFVLERFGERWAFDLGGESYHKIESMGKINLWSMRQDSSRWTIFRQGPLSHNLVTIGERRLQVAAKADIRVLETGAVTRIAMDLTDVYGRDVVSFAERAWRMDRTKETLDVSDTFKGVKAGEIVRWAMTTKAESAQIDGKRVVLTMKGKRLNVRMTTEAMGAWSFEDVSNGLNPWDSPNKDCKQLVWKSPSASSGDIRLNVCFQ